MIEYRRKITYNRWGGEYTNIKIGSDGSVEGFLHYKPVEVTIIDERRCIFNHGNRIYRMVWEAFNGPIPPRMVVHHINGIKTDDRLENLMLMPLSKHSEHHASEMSDEWKDSIRNTIIGRHWYNNGLEETQCDECPEGFVTGRIKNKNK